MNSINCLLDWHINELSNTYLDLDETEILKKARNNALRQCDLFPAFPNLDLITSISGQKYEKMDCYSNMAFLPEIYRSKLELDIEYEQPIPLCEEKTRAIRKILESVDTNSCLVFQVNESGWHEAIGTARLVEVSSKLATIIEIHGHMVWRARICNYPIFEYRNGGYFSVKEKYSKVKLKSELQRAFKKTLSLESEPDKIIEKWVNIVDMISKSKHGTSIVVLSDNYNSEIDRLTNPKVGHGIKLKSAIDLSFPEDIDKLLPQITRIDGGLLVTHDCKCFAIGCIFDGEVFEEFEGDSGRGSRFNSVKLYVDRMVEEKFECLGIIVSDDGTVDII